MLSKLTPVSFNDPEKMNSYMSYMYLSQTTARTASSVAGEASLTLASTMFQRFSIVLRGPATATSKEVPELVLLRTISFRSSQCVLGRYPAGTIIEETCSPRHVAA